MPPMPGSDQTAPDDSIQDLSGSHDSLKHRPDTRPAAPFRFHALRLTAWLGVSLAVALLVGALFAETPARFRLLGLSGIAQGLILGVVLAAATRLLKMCQPPLANAGGFLAGAISISLTAALLWHSWTQQLDEARKTSPDAAMAAQMLARMQPPDDADPEQMEAYEQSRRQFSEFMAAQSEPPESGFTNWLVHRVSSLNVGRTAAVSLALLELLAGSIAAALLTGRSAAAPFCPRCQIWRRLVRSQTFSAPLPSAIGNVFGEDSLPENADLATVQLSACNCKQRPLVNLDVGAGSQSQKKRSLELSEKQFRELKQLLDEAQGMN